MENILDLKDILDRQEITLKKFSEKTGLSYNYCSEIVRGDKFPRPDTLVKIAIALDVDIRELFKPTKEPNQRDMLRYIKEYANKLEENLEL